MSAGSDDYGEAVGFVDGEIFRYDFADHDMAVGHHGEGQRRNRQRAEWWWFP